MDNDYARKKAKCLEAINSIILLMRKNGIPLPSKYQKNRVHEDLPLDPAEREGEIMRRFRYLEPESREQMAEKLNDLLVYAEVAKVLKSDLIAIVILSKLRKWENHLLHPELEMPPLPSPSPEQKKRLYERKKNIEKRDQRTANVVQQYEEHGVNRRATVQSMDPFADHVRTITLPPQTIAPPQSRMHGETETRVDLQEQRRREIAEYEKCGAVKRKLYFHPESERNIKGPKLPEHELPLPKRHRKQAPVFHNDLEKQRQLDNLKRRLRQAFASISNRTTNPSDSNQVTTSSSERRAQTLQRKKNIEDRDRRVAGTLRQYEEKGVNRRAALQNINPLDERVRTIKLPPQTIGPPQIRGATDARVDIEEKRRKDLEKYQEYGAIRKRLHDLPDFQRDLTGPKLPQHEIPLHSSQHGCPAPTTSGFQELDEQKQLDYLRRQLQEVLITCKRKRPDNQDNVGIPSGKRSQSRKESIEERDKRIAKVIRQHEELGERRRAAVQIQQPFESRVRTTTLPVQTLSLPNPSQIETVTRVNLEQQRRRDLLEYEKFGAIRKRQHNLPEYHRDLTGPKFADHGLPTTSKRNEDQGESQIKYKELEKQREKDNLRKMLQEALVSRRVRRNYNPNSSNSSND